MASCVWEPSRVSAQTVMDLRKPFLEYAPRLQFWLDFSAFLSSESIFCVQVSITIAKLRLNEREENMEKDDEFLHLFLFLRSVACE